MHALRNFEIEIIRLLANSALDESRLDGLASCSVDILTRREHRHYFA